MKQNREMHDMLQKNLVAQIEEAANLIIHALKKGNKLLICGNGGSAMDAQHMAAELVARFEKERKGLSAIALTPDTSIITAVANDYSFEDVFSRQLEALGKEGDILFSISTSGNSGNCVKAITMASEMKIKSVSLLGRNGGKMEPMSDLSLTVPHDRTCIIQEGHIMIIHMLCSIIETEMAK
ncbi:D-sedoheptulose 7-phosphate isomerase [Candidatus Woesearchaeota archaeon]|nr:D-sedoheptulose 7-phosphate isomerase [Candidatus Woesearchaeota archaeon]